MHKYSCYRYFWSLALMVSAFLTSQAFAAGEPLPAQMGMQAAASTSAARLHEFHDFLLWIITAIALFVLALLVYVIVRYNKRSNPEPAQFSHNALIEVIWTVIPVLILVVITIPSIQLLYYTDRTENPEMTLKVTGYQWYWGYQYPDYEGVEFLSYMIQDADIDPSLDQRRLLSTDTQIVLPVDTNIQILVTAADVLHSWTVPALGVKVDAIPGRLNESWVRITKPGRYFGQCSELCGKDHSFMPVEVRAVTKPEFEAWIAQPVADFDYNYDAFLQKTRASAQGINTEGDAQP